MWKVTSASIAGTLILFSYALADSVPPDCECPNMQSLPFPLPYSKICGNDGKTYQCLCELINAQAYNQDLGGRPCPDDNVLKPSERENIARLFNLSRLICFTDGTTQNVSVLGASSYMEQNPDVGMRCSGPCPCTLECPLVGSWPRRPGYGLDPSGENGGPMSPNNYFIHP